MILLYMVKRGSPLISLYVDKEGNVSVINKLTWVGRRTH
jgi:hypothetical protein